MDPWHTATVNAYGFAFFLFWYLFRARPDMVILLGSGSCLDVSRIRPVAPGTPSNPARHCNHSCSLCQDQIFLATSVCGNLGLLSALNFVWSSNNELLLLLLILNTWNSMHLNFEHAHECHRRIWWLVETHALEYMRVSRICKMTFELHMHANSKWFNMMQSDVREHEYSSHWTK